MSRGSASESVCEPNLTPLLDLVLQILMFFMVTVNFAQDQQKVSGNVRLPDSQTARPLSEKKDRDPIFLNLLKLPDEETAKALVEKKALDPGQMKFFLKLRAALGEYVVEIPSAETNKDMSAEERERARFKNQTQATVWLKGKYLDLKRDNKGGEVPNSIIIRADRDAEYTQVFQLLRACSDAGFRTLRMRATVKVTTTASK